MAQELSRREQLHLLLEETLGSSNVYFQAPPSIMMNYPAIVYGRDARETKFADNNPYFSRKRYQVTVMDRDPDGEIAERVAALPTCSFERHFNADDLNHDVYALYF